MGRTKTLHRSWCIFCQLCLALKPAYLFTSVIQKLASVATVHPNVGVKVGVASCGGVSFGADGPGVRGEARVFCWVPWSLGVQAEHLRVHLLQLPPF